LYNLQKKLKLLNFNELKQCKNMLSWLIDHMFCSKKSYWT